MPTISLGAGLKAALCLHPRIVPYPSSLGSAMHSRQVPGPVPFLDKGALTVYLRSVKQAGHVVKQDFLNKEARQGTL
jgi:hypothetical protein